MERTIKIDEQEVRMVANGATPRLYRSIFGRDIFRDMQSSFEGENIVNSEVLENLAYVMAKQAGEEKAVEEWLGAFESPMAIIEAIPDIMDLWMATNATTVDSKKK